MVKITGNEVNGKTFWEEEALVMVSLPNHDEQSAL